MNEYIKMWKNGLEFRGRSTRQEFWLASLVHWGVIVVLVIFFMIAQIITGGDIYADAFTSGTSLVGSIFYGIYMLYALVSLLPALALAIRRLHDAGRSGWWIILCGLMSYVFCIGFILEIVFLCTDSVEDNKWGPNPKKNIEVVETEY